MEEKARNGQGEGGGKLHVAAKSTHFLLELGPVRIISLYPKFIRSQVGFPYGSIKKNTALSRITGLGGIGVLYDHIGLIAQNKTAVKSSNKAF